MLNKLLKLTILFIVLLSVADNSTMAQTGVFQKWKTRRIEKQIQGKNRKAPKEKSIKEPKKVRKARKDQENKQADREKQYRKYLKNNRDSHFEMQTLKVQERMKENEKEIKAREKARRKAIRKAGRNARKKYK